MKKKMKDFTEEEWKEYRHKRYLREKEQRLAYWKDYYEKHKDDIRRKANNRYRKKCGIPLVKEA